LTAAPARAARSSSTSATNQSAARRSAICQNERIFKGGHRVARHPAKYRGTNRLHQIDGLSGSEALHWFMQHPRGQALTTASDESIDALADLLVEA
jgi:hypothetical protein